MTWGWDGCGKRTAGRDSPGSFRKVRKPPRRRVGGAGGLDSVPILVFRPVVHFKMRDQACGHSSGTPGQQNSVPQALEHAPSSLWPALCPQKKTSTLLPTSTCFFPPPSLLHWELLSGSQHPVAERAGRQSRILLLGQGMYSLGHHHENFIVSLSQLRGPSPAFRGEFCGYIGKA